jgi:aspartate ammonia-lyase
MPGHSSARSTRLERNRPLSKIVPAEAYYGAKTARALHEFRISGVQLRQYPNLVKALAMVKLAATRANFECGRLSKETLTGIEGACQEIIAGKLHEQFRLDIYQGGAGELTNTNANEVIANRALELMGHSKGEYQYCDPEDHVNASQSANDVYQTALHIAMALGNLRLLTDVRALIAEFRSKGREFDRVVKMGRTQLQDAVPMTLGQEFGAFADALGGDVRRLAAAQRVLCEINMGLTTIGASAGVPEGFSRRCVPHLVAASGLLVYRASEALETSQDMQPFVFYSSCMKCLAIKLSKICNDLRLLASGPACGLHEINLPALASSGIPGSVSPAILEVVNMVCFRVIGSDHTISMAAEAGQLQLNVFEPVIAACIFEAQTLFINAVRTARVHCIEGITANADVCRRYVERAGHTVAATNALIGYDHATQLAAEAAQTDREVAELMSTPRSYGSDE